MSNSEFSLFFEDVGEQFAMSLHQLPVCCKRHRIEITLNGAAVVDSPSCHWIDKTHVFIRINRVLWHKVTAEKPSVLGDICDRLFVELIHTEGAERKVYQLKVSRLEKLPDGVFDPDEVSSKEEGASLEGDEKAELSGYIQASAEEWKKWVENKGGGVLLSFTRYGAEFMLAHDGARLILAALFDSRDNWLAGEEASGGKPPLWFSPSVHCRSPLQLAKRVAAQLTESTGRKILPLVFLNDGVDVVNTEDMTEPWKETGVVVAFYHKEGNDKIIPKWVDFIDMYSRKYPATPLDELSIVYLAEQIRLFEEKIRYEKYIGPYDVVDNWLWRGEYCRLLLGSYYDSGLDRYFDLASDKNNVYLILHPSRKNEPEEKMTLDSPLCLIREKLYQKGVSSHLGLIEIVSNEENVENAKALFESARTLGIETVSCKRVSNSEWPTLEGGVRFLEKRGNLSELKNDEVRHLVDLSNELFSPRADRGNSYKPETEKELRSRLTLLEQGHEEIMVLRDPGISDGSLWTLINKKAFFAVFFHLPTREDWLGHWSDWKKAVLEEHLNICRKNPLGLDCLSVVVLPKEAKDVLAEWNALKTEPVWYTTWELFDKDMACLVEEGRQLCMALDDLTRD